MRCNKTEGGMCSKSGLPHREQRLQHRRQATTQTDSHFKVDFQEKERHDRRGRKIQARLGCFTQEEGIDYTYAFSPKFRFESIRIMLEKVAAHDPHTAEKDVTSAFLYAALQEEVYLEIPKGIFDSSMDGKVLRL